MEEAAIKEALDTVRSDGETNRKFIRRMIWEPILNNKGEIIDSRFVGMRPKQEKEDQ